MPKVKGKCKRCGECCTHINLAIPPDKASVEWALARGFKLIQQNDVIAEFLVDSVCPHLVLSATLKGGCSLHGRKKPKACRDYPASVSMVGYWKENGLDPAASLGPTCGFRCVE